ncbi:MAG: TraB/GumN family protein [Chitinophagales bacterium]
MKKLILISSLSVCCLFSYASNKKKTNKTTVENKIKPDQPLSTNNSLLWQISGNGLKKASYLFGTIHEINAPDFFLGKNTTKKIKNADEVILEVDLNKVDVLKLAKVSMLPDNKSIKDYLSDTDYTALKKFVVDSLKMSIYNFEGSYAKMKPFFVEQLFFSRNTDNKMYYEMEIKKIADEKNIAQSGLETMDEQLGFLDSISIEDQLESILKTVKNFNSENARYNQLIADYKNQDLAALNKSFEEDEDTLLKQKLVDKRNSNWIPKIIAWIQTKSCFIAVGAGHLAGDKGIIQLLRNQGYTVQPISID